ncbi:glycoside hydrolase family 18 protein [Moniliophthora roreri]|nr:glycoside hydrolase family 18 protein [Moniliophthora roreri]
MTNRCPSIRAVDRVSCLGTGFECNIFAIAQSRFRLDVRKPQTTTNKKLDALEKILIITFTSTILPSANLLLSAFSTSAAHETIAKGYYPGWKSKESPVSKVPWSKYTHMTYAFALEGSDPKSLALFVKAAHEHYSSAISLSGWEYPNKQGIGCNTVNKDDSVHFLAFLQELRANPATAKYSLSTAVGVETFIHSSNNPSTDVSGFTKAFDHIVIMSYDVWGPWSDSVGHNAPLNDACAAGPKQQGSAISAVDKWSKAGMPKEKIVLGVPVYGHGFTVKKKDAFAGMVEYGYLNKNGKPNVTYRFNECSQTEYVYNPDEQVEISYGDAKAFKAKGHFIRDLNLCGFSIWEITGNYDNILLNAIREGAGLKN